jgi:hypothetical protein
VELQDLARQAQRGEPLAMAALLRALAPYVGRICGAIALDDRGRPMQETMIQVLKHLRSLCAPAALTGGCDASPCARRSSWHERDARWSPSSTSEHLPQRPSGDAAMRVEIADTLRELRPDQRAGLLLRDLEGFGEAEAAGLLEVEVGTVKSRLHRARQAFRRRWQS